ncbi:hypothetical protein D1AOALGA4SA_12258 [Olavius algarvensis Delta 1 endosymbiont]|nr:hypothetical protein D1AOALGA4SA_12258 [Olavius algarvensis Delta 1 endosymbiont]
MQLSKFLRKPFFENRNLYYKLNLIFGLFFLFPIIGFIFFSIKYNMLEDEHLPFFFLGVLIFSFIGFNIEPAHKLKIDQNKLQNCRSNILNLVNVL